MNTEIVERRAVMADVTATQWWHTVPAVSLSRTAQILNVKNDEVLALIETGQLEKVPKQQIVLISVESLERHTGNTIPDEQAQVIDLDLQKVALAVNGFNVTHEFALGVLGSVRTQVSDPIRGIKYADIKRVTDKAGAVTVSYDVYRPCCGEHYSHIAHHCAPGTDPLDVLQVMEHFIHNWQEIALREYKKEPNHLCDVFLNDVIEAVI
jgi:hypothetical protein